MSQQVRDVLRRQQQQRRLRFGLGFLAILVIGGVWAQLSKDPLQAPFADDVGFDVVDAVEEEPMFIEEPMVDDEPEP